MQQFMYSFRGSVPPPEFLDAVRRGDAGAFCLFAYNVETLPQLHALTAALHQAAREGGNPPPLIGIDQEGGQLMAVAQGATELPGNMALGATRTPELAEAAGRVLGRELLALGINLNFAPIMDVNNNPLNPVVGARSFGDDPANVSALGRALIRGLQSAGVIATAKHFPGHGDTTTDSHHAVPVVNHPRERLDAVELFPFREAVAEGVGAVLSAHVIYEALDSEQPATLSRRIMTELLRGEMGYTGLTLTDAMDMHAVSERGERSIQEALHAGNDLILLGHLPGQLDMGQRFSDQTDAQALARILDARRHVPVTLPALDVVGCEAHRAVAQEIADRAVTLVRGTLPLNLTPDQQVLVITPQPVNLTPADTSDSVRVGLADAITRRHANTHSVMLGRDASHGAILEQAARADVIIMGTVVAERDDAQAALVRALHETGKRLIVIAMRTPYDLTAFPMIDTYLCIYGIRTHNTEAAARALFGEITPTGLLPCAIPGIASTPHSI